jgi:hypothetical protein
MFDTVIKFCISVVILVSLALPCSAEDINIPLTIHEALREGIDGIDRIQEPVTVGIPFPKGMLFEKNGIPQLALEGVKDYQFRTLARWPDGSVRWALVDFQTDVKAGGISDNNVHVIRGSGNSYGKLAESKGDVIIVNTGVMTVEIKKKGFNLFDSVTGDNKEIISKGASKGIVVIGEAGAEYTASNDTKAKVSIEENGPVRAVIKAEGTHTGNNKRMMDFTVRMHFYKGKSRVKVFYTLRNASKQQFEHARILSLNLITGISMSGESEVVVAKHNGLIRERLSGKDDKLTYYQAVSDFPQEYAGNSFYYHAPIPPDYTREKQRGFVQEGYWIKKGERELTKGKRNEYPDIAFLDISDTQGKGVTVGIRFAAGWWPKSLRANSTGNVEIGLWPQENEVGYWIRYGSHNTFEIMYDFHVKHDDPAASIKKFQYPIVAKASVNWYNRNVNGIYPLYNFVSFEDENNYIKNNGWEYLVGWRKPKVRIWRYHYWGWGGPFNQHDFARIGLINFLRETKDISKAGEYFLYADTRFSYNADWAVFHSDDYDFMQSEKTPQQNKEKAELAKVVFEIEHMHWYGLPLYYYLTGDERIRESITDWSEVIKSWAKKPWVLNWDRFLGWELYSLAAMYDFTGDPSFMKLADNIFERLLSARFNPQNPWGDLFIDWDRGVVRKGGQEIKPGLMTGYIVFDGLFNYYLHMDEKNPLKERVGDLLDGLSNFIYMEPYVEGTKKTHKGDHWAFWLPYIYNLEDKDKSKHSYKLILQAFYVNLAPYLLNGDSKWLERMDKIIRSAAWDQSGVWGDFGYMDHPGLQSILYQRLHTRKDNIPPSPINDLSAKLNGKDVTLSWTIPADAVRYQIKYSTKKLVESLAFDPDKRTYQYDLNEYANWWAGENVFGEPNPGVSGTKQSHIIKGLKPGRYYFAIRSWDAFNNRSRISNLAEIEIK